MIGGPWPARARAALLAAFGVAEYGNQVQVLRDIRDLFLLNKQPEKLPTRDVLSYLRNLEDRPWNRWGSNSRNLGCVRSRSVAIAKTRSRPLNSIKLKSLRDLATQTPFKDVSRLNSSSGL